MRKAICHYSFHRRYAEEKWTPARLVQEVKALGAEGIDFHARLLGIPPTEAAPATPPFRKSLLLIPSGFFMVYLLLWLFLQPFFSDFCRGVHASKIIPGRSALFNLRLMNTG